MQKNHIWNSFRSVIRQICIIIFASIAIAWNCVLTWFWRNWASYVESADLIRTGLIENNKLFHSIHLGSLAAGVWKWVRCSAWTKRTYRVELLSSWTWLSIGCISINVKIWSLNFLTIWELDWTKWMLFILMHLL